MRALRRTLRVGLPLAIGAAALASCALAGFTVLDEVAPPSGAGGSGTSTTTTSTSTTSTTPPTEAGAGGQGGAPCGLATFPGPPSIPTPEGTVEFVAAIRSIDFGEKTGNVPGLDLDGKCTCTANKIPKGCCQSDGPTCAMATKACDGPRGIDNAGAGVFSMLSTFLGNFGSDYYSQRAAEGQWTTLLRVRDYNGTANDDRVEVDWYASKGVEHADGGVDPPAWDGDDRWYVTNDSVDTPDGGAPSLEQPRWFDKKAYVTDHVLVASMPSSVLRLAGTSAVDIRLSAGFVVARIEPLGAGKGYALTGGLLVFRWRIEDVFLALGSYRDEAGQPICTNDPFYKTGRTQLCSLPDITVEAVAPTSPCTALSVGVAFEAQPARLGEFAAPAAVTNGCPPGSDPKDDSCPPPP